MCRVNTMITLNVLQGTLNCGIIVFSRSKHFLFKQSSTAMNFHVISEFCLTTMVSPLLRQFSSVEKALSSAKISPLLGQRLLFKCNLVLDSVTTFFNKKGS